MDWPELKLDRERLQPLPAYLQVECAKGHGTLVDLETAAETYGHAVVAGAVSSEPSRRLPSWPEAICSGCGPNPLPNFPFFDS